MQNDSENKKRKITSFPRDALEQAHIVKQGWDKVKEKLVVPNLDLPKYIAKLEETQERVEKAEQLKIKRAKAIQERNVCLSELWDLTKRVRNAAKATFGDNSEELERLIIYQKSGANE
jgi:hypothetical protein